MAAVDTLSPSSGGRCLPHPNDIVTTGAVSNLPYKEEHIDNNGLCETKSAPEGVESDQLCSYSGRQRGRRRKRRNSTHENQGNIKNCPICFKILLPISHCLIPSFFKQTSDRLK